MANFPQLPYPQWLKDIINPRKRAAVGGSGFQGAHQVGTDNWTRNGFNAKFGSLSQFGIGVDSSSNGEMLAQSQRGGMVLGVTNHDGPHPDELNKAQYDPDGQRRTVLNTLDERLASINGNPDLTEDQKQAARRAVARDFYIYQRYNALLNLDQETLDRIGAGGDFSPSGIANNNADWRSGTSDFGDQSTKDYLNSDAVQNSHLDSNARNSKLWQIIAAQVPNDGTFDVSDPAKDFEYRNAIRTVIPDYGRIWVPEDPADLHPRVAAYIKARESVTAGYFDEDSVANGKKLDEVLKSQAFRDFAAEVERMQVDADPNNQTDSLKKLEREYVRKNRSDKSKLTQWADYSINRAKLTLEAFDFARDRLPADIRRAFDASTQKFRDFISKPDGSIDRIRVGAGLATGVLSIANLWVEFARRDYDPDRIADYLKVAAKEAIESLPTVALMVGAAAMAGPVGWFALGAVGGYFAIRQVVSSLVESDLLDHDGVTYKIVKSIDDSLTAFENMVGGYLDQAKKALAEGTELGLEYVTGSAIEWTAEESAAWVGDANDILVGDDLSMLIGSEENNWLIHRSAGEVYGEDGNDMLIGWLPEEIKQGQIVGVEFGAKWGEWKTNETGEWEWEEQPLGAATARELREMEAAALERWQDDRDSGLDDPANPKPKPKLIEGVVRADRDYTLTLDAGEGNDWVITILGEKATTIGGLGRDWIYNTSAEGILWGDIANSVEQADGSRIAIVDGQTIEIADDGSNADNFWYAGDTTIMDAGKDDVLKFFGVTLTGGEVGSSAWSLFAGARSGNLMVAGTVNGLTASAAATVNAIRGRSGRGPIYYDTFLPFMAYTLVDNGNGGQDLVITNLVTSVIGSLFGGTGESTRMIVKDYDMAKVGGLTSGFQALGGAKTGDLGMLFRDFNPAYAIAALAPLVQGVPIAQSLMMAYQVLTLGDAAAWTAAAALRLAKGALWSLEVDPLVIDLDGDGIETIGLAETNAYFDVDGDLFRERTGWLKGDDGFLVLDANANGRIDDIAEMFGDRMQLGYAELAQYDSNNDGRISVADLIWSELKVWQDTDRDGETDSGELKGLSALGIRELSLGTTALDATTPQGTQLLSYGSVTFDTGRVSTMFEAIFNSNDTVTKYAGESGLAPWQGADTLNAKGFGTITDLAVATANDVGLAELAQTRSSAMTAPNLRTLVAQAGDVLGAWGMTLETSRELLAVRQLQRSHRIAVVSNDNHKGAWRGAAFRLSYAQLSVSKVKFEFLRKAA